MNPSNQNDSATPPLGLVRVAIVGRPNVGKSALFNRMVGRKIAIVHDQPGVTRDRISARVEQDGRLYEFIDTGGIGLPEAGARAGIPEAVRFQADMSMEVADVILMVVDGQEGLVPLDREIASALRKFSKPVWLVVNKIDHEKHAELDADFFKLGFETHFRVSAVHGLGTGRVWERLRDLEASGVAEEEAAGHDAVRLAIVGRPNVGKSTLINRLIGDERVIVSEVPGTTRDAVDVPVRIDGKSFVLIDTAGIRHQRKIRTSVEVFSKMRSERSIRRCDIAVIVLDCSEGITRQDKMIAGQIQELGKPCMIVVNKWDLNEQKQAGRTRRASSRSEYEKELRREVPFLDYAPILFTSAEQGYRAENLWKWIGRIEKSRRVQLGTGQLNRIFTRAHDRMPCPIRHGKRMKIYYVVQQPGAAVPTFLLFVNEKRLLDESYARFLRNSIREQEAFLGCPIVFILREKERGGGRGDGRRRVSRGGRGGATSGGLSDYL